MKLLILDVNNFVYRSYHGLPPLMDDRGYNMAPAHGFMTKLLELTANDFRDAMIIAVLDHTGPTFRDEVWPTYKEHRARPDGLNHQFDLIERLLRDLDIHTFKVPGVEADDVIATLASEIGMRMDFGEVVVATTDKDLMQVVNGDEYVSIWDPWQHRRITSKEVLDKFGVLPQQVAVVQALAGDGTDGIPGVSKVGIKTAAKLINEHLTLPNLFEGLSTLKKRKVVEQNILDAGPDYVDKMLKLTTLRTDVPEVIEYLDALDPLDTYAPHWYAAVELARAEGLNVVADRLAKR